jgi:hypothetical protein
MKALDKLDGTVVTKLSVYETGPWCGVKHCICAHHMIDNLFQTKVSVTEKNKTFTEYVKRWIKSWCNSLETEEEYRHL